MLLGTTDEAVKAPFVALANKLEWQIDVVDMQKSSVDEVTLMIREKGLSYHAVFIDVSIIVQQESGTAIFMNQLPTENTVVYIVRGEKWDGQSTNATTDRMKRIISTPVTSVAVQDMVCSIVDDSNTDKPVTKKSFDFSKMNILLVEDVEVNRMIVSDLLEFTKATISEAENGSVAVDMLKKNPYAYDLIFMDIHMPEMNGLEATTRIREINEQVPIIALTASAFKEDVEDCIKAGMNDHIAKPINFDELLDKIYKYTRKI